MTALNRHNPLLWLGLLLLAWLVLGVQLAAPKVASGPFYAATEHHLGVTRWESAPRLGLDAWAADFASGDTVVPKGNVGGKPIQFDGKFYSVDGLKISQSYYEKLWQQGRPAPFLQAKEVLGSNPKIMPDPKGAPGYFRYEGAGLEMIYNPKTGQIGHIQPVRPK